LRGGVLFEGPWGRGFGGCSLVAWADCDGIRGFVAESDLHSIDAVDGWIASGSAAEDGDLRVGDKAHVHQVVLDGFGQVKCHQDRVFTDFELAENTHLSSYSDGAWKEQHPKITTRKVVIQYRTKSV
jgi:hypothetical protein